MSTNVKRDESYAQQKAGEGRRYHYLRSQLQATGLLDGPYPSDPKAQAWLAGYEDALRDLARHPEIMRHADA